MILCFTGIAAIIGIHSEIGCLFLFVWCMLVHLFTGKAGKIMAYLIFYLALSGITWAGVGLLQNDATMVLGIALSNMGILGRKAVIPLSFASCLAKEPTGSLMAALGRMRLPKAVGIAVAVMLRFFPTLGEEYRAIRNSQRFRGIGVGILHTLTHLPSTIEYILIPLALRITKVAEELSASMTVRGVRFSGKTISYRPVRFTAKDGILALTALSALLLLLFLERGQYYKKQILVMGCLGMFP